MAKDTIVITGNAEQLLKENQKIVKQNELLEKKYESLKKKSTEASREEMKRAREVEAALKKAQSPAEKYNATLREYKRDLEAGRITQEQFNKLRDVELRQLNALNPKVAQHGRAVEKSAASNRTYAESLASVGAKMFASAGVIAGLTQIIKLNHEAEKSARETVLSLDELTRVFMVQAGLGQLEGREARGKILEVAQENAVTPEKAFETSTQLISSGFSFEDSIDEALDIVLKALASANLKGASPAELIQALSKAMASYGMERNAKNLTDLLVRMRGLFAGTDVQVSDLSDFSKALPAARMADIDIETTLSALTQLRERWGPAEAATLFRNVIQNVQTAGSSPEKVRVLESMGLTPADVDFEGETMDQVFERIRRGLERLPPEGRVGAVAKIVEKANVGAFMALAEGAEERQRLGAMQRDRGGFVKGVITGQSGPAAARNRIAVQSARDDLAKEEKHTRDAIAIEQIQLDRKQLREQAHDELGLLGSIGVAVSERVMDAAILTGIISREDAIMAPAGQTQRAGTSDFSVEKLERILQDQVRLQQDQVQIQQDQARIQRQQLEETRRNRPPQQNPLDRLPGV